MCRYINFVLSQPKIGISIRQRPKETWFFFGIDVNTSRLGVSRVCVITLQHRDTLVPDIMFAKRETNTLAADSYTELASIRQTRGDSVIGCQTGDCIYKIERIPMKLSNGPVVDEWHGEERERKNTKGIVHAESKGLL